MMFFKLKTEKPTQLYLGCAKPPFHPQHLEVLKNPNDWIWVDLYVKHPKIKNWDATKLSEVKNGSVEKIYASHLLEHFPQREMRSIIKLWHKKLKKGGALILNVPDIVWAAKKIVEQDNGKKLNGYYTAFDGPHGLMSIMYGSQIHEGEFHKAGFSKKFLSSLLLEIGFKNIKITKKEDAHDMGVLITQALK